MNKHPSIFRIADFTADREFHPALKICNNKEQKPIPVQRYTILSIVKQLTFIFLC